MRCKNQEVFIKGEYEYPCVSGTLRLPNRPRASSMAEGNLEPEDDVETEEGDKEEGKQKIRVLWVQNLLIDIMKNLV